MVVTKKRSVEYMPGLKNSFGIVASQNIQRFATAAQDVSQSAPAPKVEAAISFDPLTPGQG